jgi:hypothetical protein
MRIIIQNVGLSYVFVPVVCAALLAMPENAYPQNKNYSAANTPVTPPPGNIILNQHPIEPVGSLDQLIRMSQVVIDGVVTTTLPPVVRNSAIPGAVETDSIVTVQNVIFGASPSSPEFLLVEDGGKQGGWTVTVSGDPMVQPGERYIFFLQTDPRSSIPNSAGVIPASSSVPRYMPTVYANGKVRVAGSGLISFPAGTVSILSQYSGVSLIGFLSSVQSRIQAIYPTPPPYPSNVTPLKPPPNTIFPTVQSSGKN